MTIESDVPDVTIKDQRIYLSFMAVKKEYRNQGIGTEILIYLINHARENGYSEMTLEVNLENKNAMHIYKKSGFTHIIREITDRDNKTVILLNRL